jgi:AcrR family transcriptional regulator
MSDRKLTTRQRLIQSAIQLFLAQGVTETTTRQIAELAAVNEVTLFRNFSNKNGLLLAVIEDPEWGAWLSNALAARSQPVQTSDQALRNYAQDYLQTLAKSPEFVRSLIGEAGKFPPELRQALSTALAQVNRYTTQYLATVLPAPDRQIPTAIVSLLNQLLLGYAILEVSREASDSDWEAFLNHLVTLFSPVLEHPKSAAVSTGLTKPTERSTDPVEAVNDLPASLVEALLQQAKKAGTQDYAIAYVLFATGLTIAETISLRRSHLLASPDLLALQVGSRQVPMSQWIMGQRYGSRSRNPLTQWLKTRKDDQTAMFLGEASEPLLAIELRLRWQAWSAGLVTPSGEPPAIEQAPQTWCVDMLTKGVSLEDLSILSGKSTAQLQPYARRVREKFALEQALRLDQKPMNRSTNSTQ